MLPILSLQGHFQKNPLLNRSKDSSGTILYVTATRTLPEQSFTSSLQEPFWNNPLLDYYCIRTLPEQSFTRLLQGPFQNSRRAKHHKQLSSVHTLYIYLDKVRKTHHLQTHTHLHKRRHTPVICEGHSPSQRFDSHSVTDYRVFTFTLHSVLPLKCVSMSDSCSAQLPCLFHRLLSTHSLAYSTFFF